MHFIPLKKKQVTTTNVLPLRAQEYFLKGAQEYFLPQGAGYPSYATARLPIRNVISGL